MRLHDLQVGQRFTFTNKHRGKVFEVTQRAPRAVHYTDTATGDERMATDSAKAFCMDVELATSNRVVELTQHEIDMLQWILHGASTEAESKLTRSDINKLYNKLTGLAGWRVDKPED